jgi:hypothetical protein
MGLKKNLIGLQIRHHNTKNYANSFWFVGQTNHLDTKRRNKITKGGCADAVVSRLVFKDLNDGL